jgi:ornithine carbamoyltransferase
VLDLQHGLEDVIASAIELKRRGEKSGQQLRGRTLAMIFEKSSTRTRVSFEVAMFQTGGQSIYLSQRDSQLGRGETIEDTAEVLSRYVDGIVYRAFSHNDVIELARHASVPVINALDNIEHPCQAVADLVTVKERKGRLKGLQLTYVGDGNNVCNSLALAAAMSGMDFLAATPPKYAPDRDIMEKAATIAHQNGCQCVVMTDPHQAVMDADIVYTDTWVSMGQEADSRTKEADLMPYQVNHQLMSLARPDALFMHCLPAHRGMEVTKEVIDGPQSVVFDQAENRLHAQKSILVELMG